MATTTTAPKRGLFIVVEGLDKAGKSTQCSKLSKNLEIEGKRTEIIRFPDRSTTVGKVIDGYLKGTDPMPLHTAHLLFSSNRWEYDQWIRDMLKKGITLICDRYYLSGIVYTLAKKDPRINLKWAMSPDVGLPKPDLCFFLDVSAEVAAQRGGGYGEEIYENQAHQAAVRQQFNQIIQLGGYEAWVKTVDAGRSKEEVEADLLRLSLEAFNKYEESELEDVVQLPFEDEIPARKQKREERLQDEEEQRLLEQMGDDEAPHFDDEEE